MRTRYVYLFDEKKDAEETLQCGFSDGNIDYTKMGNVAKYFHSVYGYGAVRLEKELVKFCKSQNPDFNPIIDAPQIKKWIKYGLEYSMRRTDCLVIRQSEMDFIKTVKNLKHRKLLFVMLVLSKSKHGNFNETERYYLEPECYLDIIRVSKLHLTGNELGNIINEFGNLITIYIPSLKRPMLINFATNKGSIAMTINDPEQCLEYYKSYFGGDSHYCTECGKEFTKNSGSQIRCLDCSIKVKKKQKREYIQKIRRNKKEVVDQ